MSEESTIADSVELTRRVFETGNRHHLQQRRGWVLLWVQKVVSRATAYLDIDEARAAPPAAAAAADRLAEE